MKKPITTAYFKILEQDPFGIEFSNNQKSELLTDIVNKINGFVKQNKEKGLEIKDDSRAEQSENLTIVPFFDIVYENIIEQKKQPSTHEEKMKYQEKIWDTLQFQPELVDQSKILDKS